MVASVLHCSVDIYYVFLQSDMVIRNIPFLCVNCGSVNKKKLYDVETRCICLQYFTTRYEDRIDEMMGVEYNAKIVPCLYTISTIRFADASITEY